MTTREKMSFSAMRGARYSTVFQSLRVRYCTNHSRASVYVN